ncbi:glutamate 5-kinase [Spirochaetota bacterium]|nr:glutamate 5-kinase [Spirochaetota bacterium]
MKSPLESHKNSYTRAEIALVEKCFKVGVCDASTLVVKAGSSLLADQTNGINKRYLKKLVDFIIALRAARKKVVLVSSGASAAGKAHLIQTHARTHAKSVLTYKKPHSHPASKFLPTKQAHSLSEKQVLASIGQVHLMESYRKAFAKADITISQILLSKYSINHRASYLNARNTLQALWDLSILPIINENDPLAAKDARLGDNDVLGALVCGLADADLYIILSDTEGLYLYHKSKTAKLLKIVKKITPMHFSAAQGPGSHHGTGGMVTKLEAVKVNENFSIPTLITAGTVKNLYKSIFNDHDGTLFLGKSDRFTQSLHNTASPSQLPQTPVMQHPAQNLATSIRKPSSIISPEPTSAKTSLKTTSDKKANKKSSRLSSKKRWLFSNISPKGHLTIDLGAAAALRANKSLLPKGILSVTGVFHAGDVCTIVAQASSRNTAPEPLGRGLTNYNSSDLKKICGANTSQIATLLGYKGHDEVIHKNNLVISDN